MWAHEWYRGGKAKILNTTKEEGKDPPSHRASVTSMLGRRGGRKPNVAFITLPTEAYVSRVPNLQEVRVRHL